MLVWQYALLFFSVLLGGGLAWRLKRNFPRRLKLILAFSGAYILGIAVLHLMPAVFREGGPNVGIWILLGFFIQLLLEQLTLGVEHGHLHAHDHGHAGFGWQLMLGLCLHSFLEGMPLTGYHALTESGDHGENLLLFGIVLHKAPAAFALVVVLIQSHFSRRIVVLATLIFAAMSPLGAFLTESLDIAPQTISVLMALVIGSFLHISTTILFETDDPDHHVLSWLKLLVIGLGLGLSLLTL